MKKNIDKCTEADMEEEGMFEILKESLRWNTKKENLNDSGHVYRINSMRILQTL